MAIKRSERLHLNTDFSSTPNGPLLITLDTNNNTVKYVFHVASPSASSSSLSLEVYMPIACIICFLIVLFFIYIVNNICSKSFKKSLRSGFCLWDTHVRNRVQTVVYPTRIDFVNHSGRPSLNRQSFDLKKSEEPRNGFYNVRRVSDLHSKGRYLNNNYDRIYSEYQPNNLIHNYNQDKLYKSNENTNNEIAISEKVKFVSNSQKYLVDSGVNRLKSRSVEISSQLVAFKDKPDREKHKMRRSYSISKFDHRKWHRTAKSNNNKNANDKWPSKIMSDYEMSKFLSRNMDKSSEIGDVVPNNSIDTVRCDTIDSQTVTNTEESLSVIHYFNKNQIKTVNLELPTSQESLTTGFDNKLSLLEKDKFSSSALNISELNEKSAKKVSRFRRRSSTFRQNTSEVSKESTLTKISNKLLEKTFNERSFLRNFRFGLKSDSELETTQMKKSSKENKHAQPYSRLCKSFTFLSQRVNDNFKKDFKISKKCSKSCEPIKVSSFKKPRSFRTNERNYLKNINFIKSKGFMSSMSSIFEKVASIRNKHKNENERTLLKQLIKANYNDVAIQTSILTSGSNSFNSHATTLMQTNTFGSIVANFGSASIKRSRNVEQSNRYRSTMHNDTNGLSESDTSRFG